MGNVVALTPSATTYSGAQLQLIRNTVAKDCNSMEFDLFVTVARNAGLDPFRKQISAIVFSKDDATRRRMSIITTIDGLRVIAARSKRYRPDEDEPDFEYDDALKRTPANPLGLVKARVKIYVADQMREGGWKPVTGVAYWEEFAPIKEEVEGGFDWVDTGETWPDTGKPKKRKVPRQAGAAVIPQLDTSGNWGKMPRVMLAKCAEAQALRKAFPEDMSALYEAAELDRAQITDLTPSEIIGHHQMQERIEKVGRGILFQLFPGAALESIPIGQVADRVTETVKGFGSLQQMRWFESANLQPLREFWAHEPGDALELKKVMEAEKARLEKADAEPAPAA